MTDEARLGAAVAEPKLERVMGPFASFAISMSTICILSGGITSFHVGFCSVGGASIGLGWPLVCLFSLAVALTMGQVASTLPRAGGPYQWSAVLGGRACGWAAGCFELAGLSTGVAAVNIGTCRFVVGACSRLGDYDPGQVHPWAQMAVTVLMTLSQAFINHRGMRLTTRLVDFGGYLIVVVAAVLTVALLIFGVSHHGLDLGRLVTPINFSGLPPEEGFTVWGHTDNMLWLFALGLLLPAYTLTGFDAAAQTAEETIDPRRNVPRGIVQAVLISGVAGWVMLSAVVLAAPDMREAAEAGEQAFLHIIRAATPQALRAPLYVGLAVAMYICGLSTLTATSRLAFAFARDGGTPFSGALSRIGTHHTPSVAIWTTACVAMFFIVVVGYEATAAVCAIFLYLSYVLPSAAGLLGYGRWWTRMGPWHLGRWYRPLAALCVLGCIALIIIGLAPPNAAIGAWVVGASVLGLAAVWFGYKRRHFPGPPPDVLLQLHAVDEKHPVGDDR